MQRRRVEEEGAEEEGEEEGEEGEKLEKWIYLTKSSISSVAPTSRRC